MIEKIRIMEERIERDRAQFRTRLWLQGVEFCVDCGVISQNVFCAVCRKEQAVLRERLVAEGY